MNPSPQDFSDELISAYLDGELSPEEKARVEDLLMDSPEHRRLFEELKSLRTTLHTLPRYQLGGDFAKRVIQKAEREMLTSAKSEQGTAPPAVAGASQEPTAPPVLPTPAPRTNEEPGEGSWRGMIWAVAALAAALLVALAVPLGLQDSGNQSEVANSAGTDRSSVAEDSDDGRADHLRATPPQAARERAASTAANRDESVQPAEESSEDRIEFTGDGAVHEEMFAAEAADHDAFSDDAAGEMFAEADGAEEVMADPFGTPQAMQGHSAETAQPADALAAAGSAMQRNGGSLQHFENNTFADGGFGSDAVASSAPEGFAGEMIPSAPAGAPVPSATAGGREFMVSVRISADEFNEVLSDNGIELEPATSNPLSWQGLRHMEELAIRTAPAAAARVAASNSSPPSDETLELRADQEVPQVAAELADSQADDSLADSPTQSEAEAQEEETIAEEENHKSTGTVQWMLVESSPEAISQLLAQLDIAPEEVVEFEVLVEAFSEPTAEGYRQYNQPGSRAGSAEMMLEASEGEASGEGEGEGTAPMLGAAGGPQVLEGGSQVDEPMRGALPPVDAEEVPQDATAEPNLQVTPDTTADSTPRQFAAPAGRAIRLQLPPAPGQDQNQIQGQQVQEQRQEAHQLPLPSEGSGGGDGYGTQAEPAQPGTVRVLFRLEAP